MEACRDQYVEDEQRLPTDRELFDYLNNFGYLNRRNPEQEFERALRAENIEQLGILDDYDIRDDSETNHDPEAQITTIDLKSLADIIRNLLDRREWEVVKLRNGLSDQSNVSSTGDLMTLEAVGERVNLTRERVRQIEARAHSKLRWGSYGNSTTVRSYFRELSDQELDDFTVMSIQAKLFRDNFGLDKYVVSQKSKNTLLINDELRLLNLDQRVHYRDSLDREVIKSRIGFSEDGLRINQTMTEILPNWDGYSRDLSDIIQTYLSSINVSSLPTYNKYAGLLANEVESFKDLISLDLDDYPYIRDYDSVNSVKPTKLERLVDYWIPRLLEQTHEQMESNS
jgi:hypothetical protein